MPLPIGKLMIRRNGMLALVEIIKSEPDATARQRMIRLFTNKLGRYNEKWNPAKFLMNFDGDDVSAAQMLLGHIDGYEEYGDLYRAKLWAEGVD